MAQYKSLIGVCPGIAASPSSDPPVYVTPYGITSAQLDFSLEASASCPNPPPSGPDIILGGSGNISKAFGKSDLKSVLNYWAFCGCSSYLEASYTETGPPDEASFNWLANPPAPAPPPSSMQVSMVLQQVFDDDNNCILQLVVTCAVSNSGYFYAFPPLTIAGDELIGVHSLSVTVPENCALFESGGTYIVTVTFS